MAIIFKIIQMPVKARLQPEINDIFITIKAEIVKFHRKCQIIRNY